MRRSLWKRLLGFAVVAAVAAPVSMVAGFHLASAATLQIHVSGNQLVDGAGTPVILHGADLSGTEFSCDQGGGPTDRGWSIYGGQPLDQLSTYQAMAAWNINVVRVPLNEDCWLNINGVNPAYAGANYQQAIETEVNLINQAGMVAIIDLHWTSPGPYAAVAQQPVPDADHSVAFWQSVATTFQYNPAVIYDLFNEPFLYSNYFTNPNQDAWQCWLDGCSLNQFISAGQIGPDGSTTGYTTTYTWNSAGTQTLINAIRATGASQPILVNGLDWANDDSGWLANLPVDPDGQLIAGAHDYPGESCDTTSCWDSQQAPISATYPFLVGETGDSTSVPVTFLPTFLPYATSHGWSYLAWTWNPWGYTDDVLVTDWSGTPNAGEGAYYQQYLLSLPPSPLTGESAPPIAAPDPPQSATPAPTATPTPTSTATPKPTATSTPKPTATPTPTATAKPTATPTPKPTATAKPTATPKPAATAKPTATPKSKHGSKPTPTPSPTATPTTAADPPPPASGSPLYTDNFASDTLGSVPTGWTVQGLYAGLIVTASGTSHGQVYTHDGWTATTSAGDSTWTNYMLSLDVQPSAWASEEDCVAVRYVDANDHYAFCFEGGGWVGFGKIDNGVVTSLAQVPLAYTNEWHTLSITASGSRFTVTLDGASILTVADSTFSHGAIGFDVNAPVSFAGVTVNAS
jgi:hypothetical protein